MTERKKYGDSTVLGLASLSSVLAWVKDSIKTHAWPEARRSLFIEALLEGCPILPKVVLKRAEGGAGDVPVSGMEELSALLDFTEGRLTLLGMMHGSYRGMEYAKLKNGPKKELMGKEVLSVAIQDDKTGLIAGACSDDTFTKAMYRSCYTRAVKGFEDAGAACPELRLANALVQAHESGKLDLSRLAVTDDTDFAHDISGLIEHWNSRKKKFDDMFLPRCMRGGHG